MIICLLGYKKSLKIDLKGFRVFNKNHAARKEIIKMSYDYITVEDMKASDNLINKEAERSVLGTFLVEPETQQALDIIPVSIFTGVEKTVAQSFKKLHNRIEHITVVELMEELKKGNKGVDITTLSRLSDYAVASWQQKKYIKILEDLSRKRKYYECLKKATEKASEGEELEEQVFDLMEKLEGLKTNTSDQDTEELSNIISEIFSNQQDSNDDLLKFGYSLLDDNIGGLVPGGYSIIGAKSGVGKSTLAMNIAYNVAKQGGKVLYFNLEMGKLSLVQRFMCMLSDKLTVHKFIRKKIADSEELSRELVKVSDILGSFNDNLIIDNSSFRISEINKKVREQNPDLVVIDYLQLMQGEPGRYEGTTEQKIANISRAIRKMTLKYNCHVLALVQLNDSQRGKIPSGENVIRHSASVYQDATNVIYVHDPFKDNDNTEDEKEVGRIMKEYKRIYNGKIDNESIHRIIRARKNGNKKYGLVLDKVRDGMPGIMPINFVGEHFRMFESNKSK